MDNAGAMCGSDAAQGLFEDRYALVCRNWPASADQLLEALAVDKLHHCHWCAVVHEVVKQLRDIRVIERALHARFLTEALDEFRVIAGFGAHDFNRNLPV